jgi:high-affinity Fe2+/Pb2+ permease
LRPVVKRLVGAVGLLALSAGLLYFAVFRGTASAPADASANRESVMLLALAGAVFLIAIWRFVVVLRHHGGENLL